jgi:anti-sigma factor RsiW
MTPAEPLSDAELNAYLDGELAPAERGAVEARLAERPADAERLAQLRRVDELIRARYAGVAEEPVPANLQAALRAGHERAGLRPWVQAVAAVLLLVVGGLAGYLLRGIGLNDRIEKVMFLDDALGAHSVYVVEVRHPVEVGAAEEEHLVKWLTKRIGADVRAPSLGALNFKLMGGRLLAAEGAPAAQFMYENDGGRRLTLYIRQSAEMENTAFQFAEDRGLSAFYWIDRPLAYAIIAELPREELLSVARIVYDELD